MQQRIIYLCIVCCNAKIQLHRETVFESICYKYQPNSQLYHIRSLLLNNSYLLTFIQIALKMANKIILALCVGFVVCAVLSVSARRIEVDDLEVAASDKSEHWKKGGGKDHHSDGHSSKGEKGEKGYKGHHSDEKGEKGHHDKEGHDSEYEEDGGHKKSHHDDGHYHHESEKGDKGEKGSGYEEKGSYGKGHHTKGHHIEAKGDEYGKKTNFFDEDHDEGFEEKYGDFHEDHGHKKGGSHKSGHKKGSHEKGMFGRNDSIYFLQIFTI